MYEYDFGFINEITGITYETRKRLIKWYAKQPEAVMVEAHKLQTDLMRQSRERYGAAARPEFVHSCLILALRKMIRAEEAIHAKGTMTPEDAERARRIRVLRMQSPRHRSGRKRAKLEGALQLEVERLLDEGLSYRKMSCYLEKHHGIKISYSYLCEIATEWGMANG